MMKIPWYPRRPGLRTPYAADPRPGLAPPAGSGGVPRLPAPVGLLAVVCLLAPAPPLAALDGASFASLSEEAKVEHLRQLYPADPSGLADALELAVRAEEAGVRGTALELLSRIPSERSLELAQELAAGDPSPSIRALAREAIFLLAPPPEPALGELRRALEDTRDAADRRALVHRLGVLESSGAQELIWKVLGSEGEDALVLVAAVQALDLRFIDSARGATSLEALLADLESRGAPAIALDAVRARLDLPLTLPRAPVIEH